MGICNSIPEHESINNEIIEAQRHDVNNERPLTTPTKELPLIRVMMMRFPNVSSLRS